MFAVESEAEVGGRWRSSVAEVGSGGRSRSVAEVGGGRRRRSVAEFGGGVRWRRSVEVSGGGRRKSEAEVGGRGDGGRWRWVAEVGGGQWRRSEVSEAEVGGGGRRGGGRRRRRSLMCESELVTRWKPEGADYNFWRATAGLRGLNFPEGDSRRKRIITCGGWQPEGVDYNCRREWDRSKKKWNWQQTANLNWTWTKLNTIYKLVHEFIEHAFQFSIWLSS